MSPQNLSKTLSGVRAATAEDCDALDQVFLKRLPDYQAGELSTYWFESEHQGNRHADPSGSWAVAAIILGFLVLALAIYRLAQQDSTIGTATEPVLARCTPEAGEISQSVGPDLANRVPVLREAYSRSLSTYDWPCPDASAIPAVGGSLLIQPIADSKDNRGMLVAPSDSRALVLTESQWLSYLDAVGGAEVISHTTIRPGLPLRLEERSATSWLATEGGALIAQDSSAPHFYLPTPILERWDEIGGPGSRLGLPMTNPFADEFGRILIEFESGAAVSEPGELVVLSFDVSTALPSDLEETAFVQTPDGTVWRLDSGVRRWVPASTARRCVDKATVQVSAHAIATIPLGDRYEC